MASAEKLSYSSSPRAPAVHGVGVGGAEPRDVEMLRAVAHFFVRRERDANRAVLNAGMRHQPFRRGHDLGDTALVVRSEERGAGRRHDVVTDTVAEVRHVGHPQDGGRIVGQHEIAPVIGAMHDRCDAGAAHFRRGVDMGDEPNYRHAGLARGRGNGRHHVAMAVDVGVGKTHGPQFGREQPQQRELPGRARIAVRAFARLGVVGNVAEEAFEDGHQSGSQAVRQSRQSGGQATVYQPTLRPDDLPAC